MVETEHVQRAERLSRRRARLFSLLAIYFLAGQAFLFPDPGDRSDPVRAALWLLWAGLLVSALLFAGRLARDRRVQALLEDEATRANRLEAYRVGFWAAVSCALAVYALTLFTAVGTRAAVHLVLTAGIAGALLRFGILERRDLQDG